MNLILQFCLVITLIANAVHSAVLGIDYGSDQIKVAAVQPGRPFEIVLDEASKRSHPSLVVFDNDVRQYGTQGSSLVTRRPQNSFLYFTRLLGKPFNTTMIQELEKDYIFNGITKDNKRGTIRFNSPYYKSNQDSSVDDVITAESYTVEEITAMKLKHIKKIAQKLVDGDVSDCVITVPEFWTAKERQALKDAAQLAGLNVYGLINENTAAAVQYGLKRDFSSNKTEYMIFYNMGSSSTIVSVVKYWAYEVKDKKKSKNTRTVGCVDVMSQAWDETLGGNSFDRIISKILIKQAKELLRKQKNPKIDEKIIDNLDTDARFTARIRNAAKKAKKILSANTETFVGIEGVYEDIDFKSTIKREEMYDEAGSLFDRAMKPLIESIENLNGKIDQSDIEGIVLMGGSTRIPKIKELLTDFLGKELRQDLNTDEAAAFGAAFRAANLSSTFRVLGVNLEDISSFPIGIRLSNLGDKGKEITDDTFAKRGSLFPKSNNVYKRRSVTLKHRQNLDIRLYYERYAKLPMDTSHELGSFEITGIEKAVSKYKQPEYNISNDAEGMPKIALSFLLDADGIVDLVAASATFIEGIEEENKKGEKIGKKKAHKVELKINKIPPLDVMSYDVKDFEDSYRVLMELDDRDTRVIRIARARNELESYIFESRGKLENSKKVKKVSKEKERKIMLEKLNEAEEWLWEVQQESESIFKSKTRSLRNLGDAMFTRAKELELRPKSIDAAGKAIGQLYEYVDLLQRNYSWIKSEEIEELNDMTKRIELWLNNKIEEQELLTPHDDPAFLSSDVEKRILPALDFANKLLNKQKPSGYKKKEKKNKKNTTKTDKDDNNNNNNDDEATQGKGTKEDDEYSVPIHIDEDNTEDKKTEL